MTDGRSNTLGWLFGVVLAAIVAVAAWQASPAHAQTTPTFSQNMKNATTAAQRWGYMIDKAGSASALDQKLAAAAKFNGLGMNAIRTEAPAAAKVLTKRAMAAALLPRAVAFLGPAGLTAAAAYTLCDSVFGCFKSTVTINPSLPASVKKNANGKPNIGRIPSGTGSGFTGARTEDYSCGSSTTATAFSEVKPGPLEDVTYAIDAAGRFVCAIQTGSNPSTVTAPPSSVPDGYQLRVSTSEYAGSSGAWLPAKVWTITRPVVDDMDVQKSGSTCPSGETCGTLPRPDDAVWPAQLRDATTTNNDAALVLRLGAELFPDEGLQNPYVPEVTIPKVNAGETAAAYMARLADLGLVGKLTVLRDFDARSGPDGVLKVSPDVGTKRLLKDFTTVQVTANPSYAPSPSGGVQTDPATGLPTGSATATTQPGSDDMCALQPPTANFNVSPLSSLNADRFPLSIFAWARNLLGSFSTSGSAAAPDWAIKFGPVRADVFGWLPKMEASFGGFWTWVRGLMGAVVWMGAAFGLYRQTFGRGV